MSADTESLILHSTWRGVVLGLLGAVVLSGLGVIAVVGSGGAFLAWLFLAVGASVLGVVLFDFPVASEFDADGVTRRPLLRRHRLDWVDVAQLTRARPGLIAARFRPGGLTAKVGRRRYLLVDQCESLDEFDALERVLGDRIDDLRFEDLLLPPTDVEPTWTYRRRRWASQDPTDP